MNKEEKKKLFAQRAQIFYIALANVFTDEAHREPVPQIKLEGGEDINEIMVAIMVAQMTLLSVMGSNYSLDEGLVGFTHTLNRLAIQHLFMQDEDSDEDAPVLMQMKDGQAADQESERRIKPLTGEI